MAQDTIIILEVVMDRNEAQTAQLCGSLTNGYFSQLAQANAPKVLGWGPNGNDLTNPIKLAVGSVECLLVFSGSGPEVKLIGTCTSGHWSNCSVSGNQTLQYDDGTLQFTAVFRLVNGSSIEITVVPGSSTMISASA